MLKEERNKMEHNLKNEVLTTENNYTWLRQDKEPENAYKWYTYYRDMKGTRRLNKIIDDMKAREPYLEKYPTYQQIKNASSNWCWKARTRDYDNYLQTQLIDSHKQTLVIHEEKTINLIQDLYKALGVTLQEVSNADLEPLKKLKCLDLVEKINRRLLGDLEHVTLTETPEVKYLDFQETRENNIINMLIDVENGVRTPEELAEVLEGYNSEDVEKVIKRTINKQTVKNTWIGGVFDNGHDTVNYEGTQYQIPK